MSLLTKNSFSNFINTNPDLIIELLKQLKQREMVKASELLVLMTKYCTLKCEPDWEGQSQPRDLVSDELSEPFPSNNLLAPPADTDAFWKNYQVMAENMEFYCIQRLIHHLRKIHGPMLFHIDYATRHSTHANLPKQCFTDHFQVYHNSVQNLLKALIYRVPFLRYNILVESTLFTTCPVQYRIEFEGPPDWSIYPYHMRPLANNSTQAPLAFCFTSYLKYPPQLTVPPFYFTDRDPGGLIKFIPHDCAQCSCTPPPPGLNHTLILRPPSPIV